MATQAATGSDLPARHITVAASGTDSQLLLPVTSSSWRFKAHLARNTAQEAPSPGADGVRVGEMEAHGASPHLR
jgi:hypothetical protein